MGWLDTDGFDVRVVGLVSGGHFFSHFYLLAFPPLFPMLRGEFGLSNVELGLIVSALQVGTFLQVFAGDAVDRIGGRRVFLAGLVVTAVGVGLAGFSTGYPVLLAFALLSSLGQATFHPADYALLDAASDEGYEGKSFAVHNFTGSLGFAAGPAVVGGIALVAGWQVALMVAGGLGFGYALLAYLLLDDVDVERTADGAERSTTEEILTAFRDPTLLALFAFFLTLGVGSAGIQSFTSVLVVDGFELSEATGSTALTAFFTLSAFGVLAGGELADRFRPHPIMVPAILASAVLLWVVAGQLIPPIAIAVVTAFAVIGIFVGVQIPARDRLLNTATPSGSVGTSFGFVFTGLSVGLVVGPAVLGAIIDYVDVWTAFAAIGAVLVVGAAIVMAIATGRVPQAAPAAGD